MAYPDTSDVVLYATQLGIDPGSYPFTGDVAEVVADFEARTNRRGFQSGASTTYTGDGPDWRAVDTWWIPDFSAITQVAYDGTALTEGVNGSYFLHRWKDGDSTTPYVMVEFLRCPGDKRRAYTVTGTKGYGTCPADVFRAIVRRALAIYLGAPIDGQAGAVQREKIGAREVEYDTTSGRDSISRMVSDYDAMVKRYTRYR